MHDDDRSERVPDRRARARIDRVRVAFTVPDHEVPILTGGCYGLAVELKHRESLAIRIAWTLDGDPPALTLLVPTADTDFAADIDHVVLQRQRIESARDPIDCISGCNAVQIDLHRGG